MIRHVMLGLVLIWSLVFTATISILWHTNVVAIQKTKQEQIWVNGCLELRTPEDQLNCLLLIKPEKR